MKISGIFYLGSIKPYLQAIYLTYYNILYAIDNQYCLLHCWVHTTAYQTTVILDFLIPRAIE